VFFDKMQQALGGADAISAIHDLEWTVQAEPFDHDGKLIDQAELPSTQSSRPGHTYVLYFDGTSGWEILPGTSEVRDLVGGELDLAKRYLSGFMLNTWLADRTGRFTIASPAADAIRLSAEGTTKEIVVNSRLDPRVLAAKPADLKPVLTP
jgi:hypothetical protein